MAQITRFPWLLGLAVLVAVTLSCPSAYYDFEWFLDVTHYQPDDSMGQRTLGGILVIREDIPVDDEFLFEVDLATNQLEQCLGEQGARPKIRRDGFVVVVPADWYTSACSGEQLIPSIVNPETCRSKGLVVPVECEYLEYPTEACPCVCNVRAVIQNPHYLLVTPNLKLYRAELTRLVTGINNPWTHEELLPCF
jgi:hypothetical protein